MVLHARSWAFEGDCAIPSSLTAEENWPLPVPPDAQTLLAHQRLMLRPGEPRGSAVLSREKRQAKEHWQATNLGGSRHWGNKCKSTNETVAAGARPRRLRRRPRGGVEQICGGSRSAGRQGESCGGAKHHCGSSFCSVGPCAASVQRRCSTWVFERGPSSRVASSAGERNGTRPFRRTSGPITRQPSRIIGPCPRLASANSLDHPSVLRLPPRGIPGALLGLPARRPRQASHTRDLCLSALSSGVLISTRAELDMATFGRQSTEVRHPIVRRGELGGAIRPFQGCSRMIRVGLSWVEIRILHGRDQAAGEDSGMYLWGMLRGDGAMMSE
ncbi:hypothetical protein IQ07DRAFT_600056 [Pyrenochaeta sp. DS3sAY3a]|nr:hypothetical protein IQ07DRAFT_600056 [Pyrenochaeta sp. DS3sAY3a]